MNALLPDHVLVWWNVSLIWLKAENSFVDVNFSLPLQIKAPKTDLLLKPFFYLNL